MPDAAPPRLTPSDSDSRRSSSQSSSSRSSTSRSSSDASLNPRRNRSRSRSHSRGRTAPGTGTRSTSALILVHDDDDSDDAHASFSFSDDDEPLAQAHNANSSVLPGPGTLHVLDAPPHAVSISASAAFAHFLAPCLKLGAVLTLASPRPLRLALPALLLFAFLSAFARQIWFLLARYVRRADLRDVFVEALAKRKGQERRKKLIGATVRCGMIVLRLLLSVIYLRGALDVLESLVPPRLLFIPARLFLGVIITLALYPLSATTHLASKRLTYTAWGSVFLYVAWLATVIYAHSVGSLDADVLPEPRGRLYHDVSVIALTFSTTSTLQLYAALTDVAPAPVAGAPRASDTAGSRRERRYQSISAVSLAAALGATLLVLPLLFPRVKPGTHDAPTDPAPARTRALLAVLTASLLITGIPPLLATSPTLRLPISIHSLPQSLRRRVTPKLSHTASRGVLALVALACALPGARGRVSAVLGDAALVVVLVGTFLVPALLHVTLHAFRRPLSILVPPSPLPPSPRAPVMGPSASTGSGSGSAHSAHPSPNAGADHPQTSDDAPNRRNGPAPPPAAPSSASSHASARFYLGAHHYHHPPPVRDPDTDALLQRKERALQRRRLGRRVLWDVGVWGLLLPVAGAGCVWAVGREVGAW